MLWNWSIKQNFLSISERIKGFNLCLIFYVLYRRKTKLVLKSKSLNVSDILCYKFAMFISYHVIWLVYFVNKNYSSVKTNVEGQYTTWSWLPWFSALVVQVSIFFCEHCSKSWIFLKMHLFSEHIYILQSEERKKYIFTT